MAQRQLDNNYGFITLMSVLLLGLVAVELSIALLLFGTDAARSSISIEEAGKARALTNACAEEALQELRNSPSFSGNGSLSIGGYACSFAVSGSGGNRTILASSTVGASTRKAQIVTSQIAPQIQISSWQEVAN